MNRNVVKKITSSVLLCSMIVFTSPVMAFTKDETIYTKVDSNGKPYETIVNNHLKNSDSEKELQDLSDLLDIINVGGDESFSKDGNKIVWKANGDDIYYQGKTDKELPIDLKIKYELDGKEISADKIAGKSGKVKVTIEFINKDKHEVNINGKNEILYTPFIVVCGTIISNDNNKNISITTGKVIDNGNKSYVIGMALPGMQDSLGISQITIPEKVEITMDSKNFDLGSIITYTTPKIVEDTDLDFANKINDLFSQIETLQNSSTLLKNGSEELSNGANELSDGISTFASKSHEFNSAVNQLSNGTDTINSNYSLINNGISALSSGSSELAQGTSELNSGVQTLSSSLSALPNSISSIYTGTSGVVAGLNGDGTASNPGLVAGINSLVDSASTTTTNLATALSNISNSSAQSISILTANNTNLQAAIDALDPSSPVVSNLQAQIEMNNTAITSYTSAKNDADNALSTLNSQSAAASQSATSIKNGISQIQSTMNQINTGVNNLNNSISDLPTKLNELSAGCNKIAYGTSTLASKTQELNLGANQLGDGIGLLNNNTKKLLEANNQLTSGADTFSTGANKLSDGAKTLAEGIAKFDTEGIQKIYSLVNGNVKDFSSRVQALKKLSDEYNNFTMINDSNKGMVKFVTVVDSLKSNKNDDTVKEETKSN